MRTAICSLSVGFALFAAAHSINCNMATDKPDCPYRCSETAVCKAKKIVHGIDMTHSCFSRFYKELGAWRQEESAP